MAESPVRSRKSPESTASAPNANSTVSNSSRRAFLSHTGSALAAAAAIPLLNSVQAAAHPAIPAAKAARPPNHDSPSEEQPGANNTANDQLNPTCRLAKTSSARFPRRR